MFENTCVKSKLKYNDTRYTFLNTVYILCCTALEILKNSPENLFSNNREYLRLEKRIQAISNLKKYM